MKVSGRCDVPWKLNNNCKTWLQSKVFKETTVSNLLSEVKVSGVTSIPCVLEGEIIGRGNPGCIFNEDFIIKDQTGIIFLDYKHVFRIMDKYLKIMSLWIKK